MTRILQAKAYANNEVAFIAWTVDGPIPGCLGFEVVREYIDDRGNVTESVPLAAYVAFKGQSNKEWKPQNTSVWPVQKYSWRDLTLRKKRNEATRRPDEVTVRYSIRPVGKRAAGKPDVVPRQETTNGTPNTYKGSPLALSYLADAERTNAVRVTQKLGAFDTTFTNGIISTQFIAHVLEQEGGDLAERLHTPGDKLRTYLSGDVLPLLTSFFARPEGRFKMALYELDDEQLLDLIKANATRIDLILSNTGQGTRENGAKGWDARNEPARNALIALAKTQPGFTLQHRMFNNAQIGHNKFGVWVDDDGKAQAVLTGSTNWTWSGLSAQSNNATVITDPVVAEAFAAYWTRLSQDVLPLPKPFGKAMSANNQGQQIRSQNQTPGQATITPQTQVEVWFSPNTPERKHSGADSDVPPDLDRLYSLMRKAKRAILFLCFNPSPQGRFSIIEEAIRLGRQDKSLLVVGAISEAGAMPGSIKGADDDDADDEGAPFVLVKNKISVIRASALTDKTIAEPLGNFVFEKLTPKGSRAIIHDKVLVIDPADPERCVVAFGSHNFGYKASFSNDENLVVVRGNKLLATAYATHVLDIYDHYRFRAAQAQMHRDGKKAWDGFLKTDDSWQKGLWTGISDYFANPDDT